MYKGYSYKLCEKYYAPVGVLNEKFRDDNIAIIAPRQTGKTYLTTLLVFHYGYSSPDKVKLCTLMRDSLTHRLDEICYYVYGDNKSEWGRTHYDFLKPKHYRIKKPFLNYLKGNNMDIIVIDEIFYLKFTDDELLKMFHICKENNTKVIINGTPQFLIQSWEDRSVEKLKKMGNLKIIGESFIVNLPNYNRLEKIKKLKEQCEKQTANL